MTDKSQKDQETDDQLSDEEAEKRGDEVLKRMLNTPPKPNKKGGKSGKSKRD